MSSCYRLRSAVDSIMKPIDCRSLRLSLSFYMLNAIQVSDLRNHLMRFFGEKFGEDAIFDWFCNSKRISARRIRELLYNSAEPNPTIYVGFSGYMRGSLISNLTTLRKYEHYISVTSPLYTFGWDAGELESVDYPAYLDSIFSGSQLDRESLLDKVYQIFCEPQKEYHSFHCFSDLGGGFYADPYEKHPNYFYGHAYICISAFCAAEFIDAIAEELALLAQELSARYIHINAHVGLQPFTVSRNPYMRYFGHDVAMDGTHSENQCTEREWYPYYYLCDIEWLNILSPLTRSLLPLDNFQNATEQDFIMQSSSGGSLLVKSLRPISDYNRDTALNIKHALLDALYPGRSAVPLSGLFPKSGKTRIYSWCPRNDWAIVPIEKEEMEIIGTNLVYISKNYMTYE